MSTDRDKIRLLNDQFRQNLLKGKALMTPGIAALGAEVVQRLVQAIGTFDYIVYAVVQAHRTRHGHVGYDIEFTLLAIRRFLPGE